MALLIDWDDPRATFTPPRRHRLTKHQVKPSSLVLNHARIKEQAKVVNKRRSNAKKVRERQAPLDGSGASVVVAVWDRRPDAVELAKVALHNAKAAAFRNAQALTHVAAWQDVLDGLINPSTLGV